MESIQVLINSLYNAQNFEQLKGQLTVALTQVYESATGGGVESVTGDLVDNTDPANPVVNLPYLYFEALLTQTGTDAPTVTILHNNTGITWTEVYNAVGVFFLEPDIVPDFRNVSVYCTNGTSSGNIFAFWRDDKLNIRTESAGTPTNSILLNSSVEIRIYP